MAGVLEHVNRRRIGDAEEERQPERRAIHLFPFEATLHDRCRVG